MGCGGTLVKVILFVANVIIALAGLCLAGVGTTWLVYLHQETFNGVKADAMAIGAVVVGAVAFVIAFFGCCGAIMESKALLVIYSVLLIILMNLKTALATVLFIESKPIQVAIEKYLTTLFDNNVPSFHEIEKSFGCCGTKGAMSYVNKLRSIPATCCSDSDRLCIPGNSYYGCNDVVLELVSSCSEGVAAFCIALIALELVLVIFSLCLADHAGNKYKGRY